MVPATTHCICIALFGAMYVFCYMEMSKHSSASLLNAVVLIWMPFLDLMTCFKLGSRKPVHAKACIHLECRASLVFSLGALNPEP